MRFLWKGYLHICAAETRKKIKSIYLFSKFENYDIFIIITQIKVWFVLLYCCTILLLNCCTFVLLYFCTVVLLKYCAIILLYRCTNELLYCCTIVLLYYCTVEHVHFLNYLKSPQTNQRHLVSSIWNHTRVGL